MLVLLPSWPRAGQIHTTEKSNFESNKRSPHPEPPETKWGFWSFRIRTTEAAAFSMGGRSSHCLPRPETEGRFFRRGGPLLGGPSCVVVPFFLVFREGFPIKVNQPKTGCRFKGPFFPMATGHLSGVSDRFWTSRIEQTPLFGVDVQLASWRACACHRWLLKSHPERSNEMGFRRAFEQHTLRSNMMAAWAKLPREKLPRHPRAEDKLWKDAASCWKVSFERTIFEVRLGAIFRREFSS